MRHSILTDRTKVAAITSGAQNSLPGTSMGYGPLELPKPETQIKSGIRGERSPALVVRKPIYQSAKIMKLFGLMFFAFILTVLLGGCLTPEEQEDQTNQRRYDAIIKQNQNTIDQNQQKHPDQN